MDWQALFLSLKLAFSTALVMLPFAVWVGRWLAYTSSRFKSVVEAFVLLPLVLPPTVLGFYLLVTFSPQSMVGHLLTNIAGGPLVFSFSGILLASIIANIPFSVQPVARAFEAIPENVREAAFVSGLTRLETFKQIEMPLAWPGFVTGLALVFAHTLGEFGAVLMMGGNIPGETRTLSIAIYDRVQAFRYAEASTMSAILAAIALSAVVVVLAMSSRRLLRGARAGRL